MYVDGVRNLLMTVNFAFLERADINKIERIGEKTLPQIQLPDTDLSLCIHVYYAFKKCKYT